MSHSDLAHVSGQNQSRFQASINSGKARSNSGDQGDLSSVFFNMKTQMIVLLPPRRWKRSCSLNITCFLALWAHVVDYITLQGLLFLLEEGFRGAPKSSSNPICTVWCWRLRLPLHPQRVSHLSLLPYLFSWYRWSFRVLLKCFLKFLYKDKYICQLHRLKICIS